MSDGKWIGTCERCDCVITASNTESIESLKALCPNCRLCHVVILPRPEPTAKAKRFTVLGWTILIYPGKP